MLLEVLVSIFLIIGAFFLMVGSIGLFRLPDFYMRLHAPTKASTLGIGAILLASIVYFSLNGETVAVKDLLITVFLFLTAPITAHMLSKAALHVRQPPRPDTLNIERLETIRERNPSEDSA